MPISLQPADHFKHAPSLLQKYKKNPAKFMEEMSKVEPDRVGQIIGLLQALLEQSEARQATLEQELQQASDNLGQASNGLLDAQGNLASAVTARETAENNLATSQGIREEKQTDHDEAVQIRDDQVDGLNGEVQVLRDVVAMLKTLLPSGGSGWSEFSRDVACEGNGAGRDSACDVANGGGIECCQESALARGFQFVVWWENMCYATTTCDDPYNLVDTVNYHHDGSSLISVTKVSSSPDAGGGGRRRLLSMEMSKADLAEIIKNPKKFIAEMSKADPDAVQSIIDMLEQLIADNENTVSAILQHVDDTAQALNAASAQVVADEDALGSAQGDEASAELALSEAETAEASAETARNEAQGVYDGEIDTLSNEQQVLREVIAMLESLLSGSSAACSDPAQYIAGDGSGGTEQNLGQVTSVQQCVDLIAAADIPNANGVTVSWNVLDGVQGHCFVEIGMTGIHPLPGGNSWFTCAFDFDVHA